MDMMQPVGANYRVQRRVAGYHDVRMDGMADLLLRARDMSVLDLGCNRGMVGFEFACNGASLVHGCDIYETGITVAREVFADLRSTEARFEVIDLTKGPDALAIFGGQKYDVTLMLATYHKLKRIMPAGELSDLIKAIGKRTKTYFAWRGTSDKAGENHDEMMALDRDLGTVGMTRIHTSLISTELGICAIWGRP